MSNFDWLGLAQAITYAHCEAQGLKVSEKENVWQSHVERKHVKLAAEQEPQSSVHGGAAARNTAIQPNAVHSTSSTREANESKVSASTLPAAGRSRTTLADEGESSVASPSFQGLTVENLVNTVERIQDEH